MRCDECGERDGVVTLHKVVKGEVSEVHLCAECASAQGIETTAGSVANVLGAFLQAVQSSEPLQGLEDHRCAFCGMSLQDFRSTGRLGCAHCYESFEGTMRELLRRIHGSATHVGRRYEASVIDDGGRAATLRALQDRLQRAVTNEEFELAASLRDEIRSLE